MNYKKYLANGIKVSELGFGAWQLGVNSGWQPISERESERMIRSALEHGINFFDTAPNYGYGTSESRLGKVFKTIDRSKIVVNTKFGRLDNGQVDFDVKHLRGSVEKSLTRLKIDYLDSVIIHSPPMALLDGHKNDHYELLEKLQEEGKIMAYGASIDFYEEIKIFLETTNAKVIQCFFNIFHQDAKRAFDLTQKKEAAVIAKIPFDSGWLTGKYDHRSQFEGVRSRWSAEDKRTRSILVEKVKKISNNNVSLMATALTFCSSFEAVSTVIPGAITSQQLLQNIAAMQPPMDNDSKRQLEDFYANEVEKLNLPW